MLLPGREIRSVALADTQVQALERRMDKLLHVDIAGEPEPTGSTSRSRPSGQGTFRGGLRLLVARAHEDSLAPVLQARRRSADAPPGVLASDPRQDRRPPRQLGEAVRGPRGDRTYGPEARARVRGISPAPIRAVGADRESRAGAPVDRDRDAEDHERRRPEGRRRQRRIGRARVRRSFALQRDHWLLARRLRGLGSAPPFFQR